MKNSDKIALSVTVGLILGIVLFLLGHTYYKEIKENHATEIQQAYESGYVKGYNDGHKKAVSETMEIIDNANKDLEHKKRR